ncbi:hypothetical protein CTA2_1736 [Colletotrichum tanaceti]|uniref:Uncharacterized protein n=1 Tax=Colletotrichum tanaceti TaxID=1306861 RepID=A0A4U6XI83_9PEZI|nr:hypothetical protein CTA2_1736 [Colletotrichum tanaceti]TKW55052.1 hypothetical protein CTA1_13213 [Colletotrichum tanaceti]
MKTSVIAVIAGALAAAVNGVPIADNANMAVTQAAQAHAASSVAVAHGLIHGVGPHRFDHIHGPPGAKMPGDKEPGGIVIIRPSVSFEDAHTQTEMPTSFQDAPTQDIIHLPVSSLDAHTQTEISEMPTSASFQAAPTQDIIHLSVSSQDAHTRTEIPTSFQDAHTQTEMPTSVSFQDAPTQVIIHLSVSSQDAPTQDIIHLDQSSEDMRVKRTQMLNMPTRSISMSTPASNTAHSTSSRVGNVEWVEWYLLCSGGFFGWVPPQCATMTPYGPTGPEPSLMLTTVSTSTISTASASTKTSSTGAEPTLMLTTDHTVTASINKKTSSTEAEPTLMLTTDSSVMATIDKKTSSTESELSLMLTTIASMITPTPTKEEATSNTPTSTITESEDPKIEYTFAKVAKSPVVTRLG